MTNVKKTKKFTTINIQRVTLETRRVGCPLLLLISVYWFLNWHVLADGQTDIQGDANRRIVATFRWERPSRRYGLRLLNADQGVKSGSATHTDCDALLYQGVARSGGAGRGGGFAGSQMACGNCSVALAMSLSFSLRGIQQKRRMSQKLVSSWSFHEQGRNVQWRIC